MSFSFCMPLGFADILRRSPSFVKGHSHGQTEKLFLHVQQMFQDLVYYSQWCFIVIERMFFRLVELVDVAFPMIVQLCIVGNLYHENLRSFKSHSVIVLSNQELFHPNIQILQGSRSHMHRAGTAFKQPQRWSRAPLQKFGNVLDYMSGHTQRVQLGFKLGQNSEVRFHIFGGPGG